MRSNPVPAPATSAANDARMPRARKLRMFLVEDSINMQLAMRELFDPMAGFEVIATARSEMAAVDWLLQKPATWDVASLDLMLGDGSGYNLIRRCRAAAPAAKIVVFSEYVTDVVRGHCMQIGADAAFNKSQIKEYAAYMDGLRDSRMA